MLLHAATYFPQLLDGRPRLTNAVKTEFYITFVKHIMFSFPFRACPRKYFDSILW